MKERDESEENSILVEISQGFAREAYPVRYVDRAKPRKLDQD